MILEIFLIFFVELYIVGSFSEINIKLILTSILKSILLLRESTIFLLIVFLACRVGFKISKSITISLSKTTMFLTDPLLIISSLLLSK